MGAVEAWNVLIGRRRGPPSHTRAHTLAWSTYVSVLKTLLKTQDGKLNVLRLPICALAQSLIPSLS
jgi:hypothetical protein